MFDKLFIIILLIPALILGYIVFTLFCSQCPIFNIWFHREILKRQIVELYDFQDVKTYSIALRTANGKVICYVFPVWKVGLVELLPNGEVGGACYIERWQYVNKGIR